MHILFLVLNEVLRISDEVVKLLLLNGCVLSLWFLHLVKLKLVEIDFHFS